MSAVTVAVVFLIVWSLLIPAILKLFKTPFEWLDIPIAVIPSIAIAMIPTIGPIASFASLAGLLYWRINERLFPDIIVAVALTRLACIPVLMMLDPRIVGH